MRIGVPVETAAGETRVAATPETVKKLVAQGHTVCVQAGAGLAASVPDQAYATAGAEIGDAAAALSADLALKAQAPGPGEPPLTKRGRGWVAMIHPLDKTGPKRLG